MSIIDAIKATAARTTSKATLSAKQKESYFKPFTEMTSFNMKINEAYALLGAIFVHEAFFKCGGFNRSTNLLYDRQASAKDNLEHAISHTMFENKIAEDDKHVIFSVKFPNLNCFVGGLPPTPNGFQAAQRDLATQIISSMFENFHVDDLPLSDNHVLAAIPARKIAIENVASIKIDNVPPLNLNDWNKMYRGLVTFSLQPYDIETRDAKLATHTSPHMSLKFKIGVTAIVKVPKDYARWATNAAKDSLNLVAFYNFFRGRYEFFNTGKVRGQPPKSVAYNPSQIQNIEKHLTETYNIAEKPQVNEENLCSLPDGRLIWVAPSTKVDVDGIFNSCLEDADADGFKAININALSNRHVYTSWLTNKMIVTDANGEFKMIDLNGARPPSQAALAHLMTQSIGEHIIGIEAVAQRLEYPINFSELSVYNYTLQNIAEGNGKWENLIDVPFSADEGAKRINEAFYDLGRQITEIYNRLTSSNIPAYEQYEVRGYLALVAVYGKKRMEYTRKLTEQSALNKASVQPTVPQLHDLKGLPSLMPHQVRVFSEMETEPTGALLDISAGGGKSATLINDISKLMRKGKIKRPMILMPRNLLGQFAKEIIKFSKGNFRPFILSTSTWRSMQQPGYHPNKNMYNENLDTEIHSLVRVLRSLKRNTILLVDYNWLRRGYKDIEILGAKGRVFPHAMVLDRIGVDYVAADESQRIKKLSSGRTQAATLVFANAKFKRLSSGTLLHNTIEDLVGQMAVIEPLALGDIGELMKQKITPKTEQARRELENNIANFSRRVTVRRREWAHMLPTIRENVYQVKMTKAQQKYNDSIMTKELSEIMKDERFKALSKTDPQAAERRLQKLLKRKFQSLEIWLNAPDVQSDLGVAFANLSGVKAADLESPKIGTIDSIIDLHLRGGKDPNDSSKQLPPDPNKILVLSYNVDVSKHVFAHSNHKGMGIHFKAGDDAAMAAFLSDKPDSPKIMFADYGGITEGYNMQCVSRMIMLQSPWTPGMMEQLVARAWRPDVPDKNGEVKYPRKYLFVDHVTVIPSIEVCKVARLIAKQVDNLRFNEEGSSVSLRGVIENNPTIFENLKTVRMNLDTIKKYAMESEDTDTTGLLNTAYTAYKLTKGWEDSEFESARKKLDQDIIKRTGKTPTTKNRMALSMFAVESDETKEFIPNKALQSHGFTPWVDSYTGFNPTSLHLIPLSTKLEEDADDEDEDDENIDDEGATEETIHVEAGDPVLTQYGPGYIYKIRKGSSTVNVVIPGYSKEVVSLKRVVVLGSDDPKTKDALRLMLRRAGKAGLPTIKLDPSTQEVTPLNNEVPEQNVLEFLKSSKAFVPNTKKTVLEPIAPRTTDVIRGQRGRIGIETPKPMLHIPREDENEKQPIIRGQKGKIGQPVVRGQKGRIDAPRILTRAPGIEKDPVMQVRRGRPPLNKSPIKPSPSLRQAAPLQVMDIRKKVEDKDLWTTVNDADGLIVNGVPALEIWADDKALHSVLTRMGFSRVGQSVRIDIRNPGGFKRLVSLLASKFSIPRTVKAELDYFADLYAEKRQNIAFAKNNELTMHRLWLKDQVVRAKAKNEIRPWPVVMDGRVYIYINLEMCPAATKLKSMTMPTGVGNKKLVKPELLMMFRSTRDAKQMLKELETKHIRFDDEDKTKLLQQFAKIK